MRLRTKLSSTLVALALACSPLYAGVAAYAEDAPAVAAQAETVAQAEGEQTQAEVVPAAGEEAGAPVGDTSAGDSEAAESAPAAPANGEEPNEQGAEEPGDATGTQTEADPASAPAADAAEAENPAPTEGASAEATPADAASTDEAKKTDQAQMPEAQAKATEAAKQEDALTAQASATTFTDVPSSHWAYGTIRRAVKLGVFSGYAGDRAGQFGPGDQITRGQVAVILWRMAGMPSEGSTTQFSDVVPTAYYGKAVAWASSKGVVSGYSGERAGQFGPNDPVTREQFAVMVANYARRVVGLDTTGYAPYYFGMTDRGKVSGWASESVAWCFRYGILSGSGGKLKPTDASTRAEACKMSLRLYDRATSPWKLTASVPSTSARAGSVVTLTPAVEGDAGSLKWAYALSIGSNNWASSSPSFYIGGCGAHTLTVTATDAQGRTQCATACVSTYELNNITLKAQGEDSWFASAYVGVYDNWCDHVQYRFSWTRSDGASGEIRDWSADPNVLFDKSVFGGKKGTFTITVEARDGVGTFGSKSTTLKIEDLDDMSKRAQSFSSDTDYLVLADCGNNWVGVYTGYKGNWKRVRHMRCTSGAPWSPTIKGTFKVTGKGYVFGSGYSCYYYTQFYGDYLFHSVLYDEGAFDVQDGRLGESLSHGCVRLAIEDAKWIWDNVPYGSTVHTYA